MQAAASFVISGATAAYKAIVTGTTPVVDKTPEKYENHLEPFSLIVSLAIASFHPLNTKPTQIKHHIEWERPNPVHMGIATIEKQGLDRAVQNLRGTAKAGHQVIELWERHIMKAICWYQPHVEGNEVIRGIFEKALTGLQKVLATYENEKDQTPGYLRDCIRRIKECLEEGRYENLEDKALSVRIKALWDVHLFEIVSRDLNDVHTIQLDLGFLNNTQKKERFEVKIDAVNARLREREIEFYEIIKEGPGF